MDNSQIQDIAAQIAARGPTLDKLAPAYVDAWAELGNVTKDAHNPHFNSGFTSLGALLDTIKPVFAKHGLAFYQSPGEMDGEKLTIVGLLIHRSGQCIHARMQIPIGKPTAQAVGSGTSYGRRYQLAAIGGIAQVDDDGEEASAAPAPAKAKARVITEPGYAAKVNELADKIAACTAIGKPGSTIPGELEFLKPLVKELGDSKLTDLYIARKDALRGAK